MDDYRIIDEKTNEKFPNPLPVIESATKSDTTRALEIMLGMEDSVAQQPVTFMRMASSPQPKEEPEIIKRAREWRKKYGTI